MKRKLISMICALSMVFSVLGGFSMISANAVEDVAITATGTVTDGTATIEVAVSGFTTPVSLVQFAIALNSEEFDVDNITYAKGANVSAALANYKSDGYARFSWYSVDSSTYLTEDQTVLTITVPVLSGATLPITDATLAETVVITTDSDYVETEYSADTENVLTVNDATITEVVVTEEPTEAPTEDPDATEAPTARPTLDPSSRPTKVPATEAPVETEAPEVTPDPYDQKIAATGSIADGVATIDVAISGFTTPVSLVQFALALNSEEFDVDSITYTKGANVSAALANYKSDGYARFSWYSVDSSTYLTEDQTVLTITVPVLSDVTLPITDLELAEVVVITTDSDYVETEYSEDTENGITIYAGDLAEAVATDEPTETDEPVETDAPEVAAEVTVADAVGSDNVTAIEEAYAADSTVEIGLSVTFYDEDGEELTLTYGDDFVVVDSDGTVLTADEYENLINGYDTETLVALLDGTASFVIYNDSVASIATDVLDWTNGVYIGDTTTTTTTDEPASTTAPSTDADGGSWSWSDVSLRVDKTVTLNATYTDGDGTKHTYKKDEIEYEIESGSAYADLDGNELTGVKRGTVYVTATYVDPDTGKAMKDSAGEVISDTKKITVSSASSSGSSGSSSSSTSSGTGTIASGNYSNNATINYTVSFTDLDDVTWAQTAIYGLASKNVIAGYDDGTFRPNNNITRAEFAKLLVLTFGFGSFQGASANFNDVPSTHWAYEYVAIAYTLGAITGYSDTEFGPEDNITREQMATMIYRLVTNYNVTLNMTEGAITFDDDWAISDYAREAVTTLQQADVINGMGDGTFAPQDYATRAQAAVMLYKFVN